MEDKELTTRKLFEAIKTCREFKDVASMWYYNDNDGYEAVVISLSHPNGFQENIYVNVTADSCGALIQDVWKKLYALF